MATRGNSDDVSSLNQISSTSYERNQTFRSIETMQVNQYAINTSILRDRIMNSSEVSPTNVGMVTSDTTPSLTSK